MTTATIPNLWPEIKVDVITPFAILQAQASQLAASTKGLLRAEISEMMVQEGNDPQNIYKWYDFDIVAPVLNKYRHTLLSVTQLFEYEYPVRVESVADDEDTRKHHDAFASALPDHLRSNLKTVNGNSAKADATLIYTDTAFIEKVGAVLKSPQVQAIIYSLLARSNEQSNLSPPQDKDL